MINLQGWAFNMFGEITYLVWDTVTGEGMLVDAGMSNDEERAKVDRFIADNGIRLKYLVNTHMHVDHAFGVPYVKAKYNLGLSASPADAFLAERIKDQARMFGIPLAVENLVIDHQLKDGDRLTLGAVDIIVIAVPGHSPGGLSLYCPVAGWVITGDSLFEGSIGRTDLPGGDYATLIKAVTDRLLSLPADTQVFPGHGPSTTIGHEKQFNPYL